MSDGLEGFKKVGIRRGYGGAVFDVERYRRGKSS